MRLVEFGESRSRSRAVAHSFRFFLKNGDPSGFISFIDVRPTVDVDHREQSACRTLLSAPRGERERETGRARLLSSTWNVTRLYVHSTTSVRRAKMPVLDWTLRECHIVT